MSGGVVRCSPFGRMPGSNAHLTSGSVLMCFNSCSGVRLPFLLMSNRLVHSWAPFIGTPGADSQAIDAGARAQNGSPGWKWGFVVPGIPVTGSFATPWQDVQCS